MKLIGRLNAVGGLHEAIEEYAPEQGATQSQIIDVVRKTFNFQGYPQLDHETMSITPLVFVGGQLNAGGTSFAISQLVMEQNADVVVTVTTDQAEKALNALADALDSELGFRFSSSPKKMLFVSNVVVEFDRPLEECLGPVLKIQQLVNRVLAPDAPLTLKRLTYGGPQQPAAVNSQYAVLAHADFVIERRAGSAIGSNRYYCSAPMRTDDHLKLLGDIETLLLGA